MKLHNFTAICCKFMYQICVEKNNTSSLILHILPIFARAGSRIGILDLSENLIMNYHRSRKARNPSNLWSNPKIESHMFEHSVFRYELCGKKNNSSSLILHIFPTFARPGSRIENLFGPFGKVDHKLSQIEESSQSQQLME